MPFLHFCYFVPVLFNFALKVGWSLRFFPATLYLYLIRLLEASHVCYPNVNQDSGVITREKTFCEGDEGS